MSFHINKSREAEKCTMGKWCVGEHFASKDELDDYFSSFEKRTLSKFESFNEESLESRALNFKHFMDFLEVIKSSSLAVDMPIKYKVSLLNFKHENSLLEKMMELNFVTLNDSPKSKLTFKDIDDETIVKHFSFFDYSFFLTDSGEKLYDQWAESRRRCGQIAWELKRSNMIKRLRGSHRGLAARSIEKIKELDETELTALSAIVEYAVRNKAEDRNNINKLVYPIGFVETGLVDCENLEMELNISEIAEALNTNVRTAGRIFSRLEKAGVVRTSKSYYSRKDYNIAPNALGIAIDELRND